MVMAGPPSQPEDESNSPGRSCAEALCRRRPFFGPVGGKPMFCQQHSKKSEGMVDVSSRRCEAVGCAKWPLYGNEGQKAKFCSLHKSVSMIDVRSRRCAAPDCKRQPSYGFEGKRACFCAAHKAAGMVDVVSRRCEKPNCRRRPLYGYEGQRSQFCSAHKQEGQVDVCNRRCQHPGCSKRPCFGLRGQRPCFCGTHRTPQMVDVISHKCGYPGCSHPTGYEANRVRSKFCDKHKSAGLAGASLLQLASAAVGDFVPPRAAQTPPERTWPKDKLSKDSWDAAPASNATPEDGRDDLRPGTQDVSADPPRRRASYAAPSLSSEALSLNAALETSSPRRRASYAAPSVSGPGSPLTKAALAAVPQRRSAMPLPLPSLGSLLENAPRSHLKRQRDGIAEPYDMDVDKEPPPPSSASAMAAGPAALEGGSLARPVFRGDEMLGGTKNGGGDGAGKTPHQGVDGDGSRDASSSSAAAASGQHRPFAGAKRLFSGRGGGHRWGAGEQVWKDTSAPSTGYVTSRLKPDWRSPGLASVGRAASFDEAREATDRQGLDAGDDGKPRRASAFVTHGSALSPVVTEMGRRDSAIEPRKAPVHRHHFHDLLSAQTPFRSVTAYGAGAGMGRARSLAHLPENPDSRIEAGRELDLHDRRTHASGGVPSWNAPAGGGWIPSGSGARGAGAEDSKPSGLSPNLSRKKKLFHVMPATAAYSTLGSQSPPEECGSAAQALPPRFSWHRERSAQPRENAWGQAAAEQEAPSSSRSEAGVGAGAGAESDAPAAEDQQQRRWSVRDTAPALSDKDNRQFVPAWGASMDQAQAPEEDGGARDNAGAAVGSGMGRSRRSAALFGGNRGGGRGGGGGGVVVGESPLGRPMRRDSTMSAAPSGREASSSGPGVSLPRHRTFPERSPPPPDREGPPSASSFVPAWGAPSEDAQGSEASTRQEAGAADGSTPAGGTRRTAALFGGRERRDEAPFGLLQRSASSAASPGAEGQGEGAPQERRWSVLGRSEAPPWDKQRVPTPMHLFGRGWGAPADERAADACPSGAGGGSRRGSVRMMRPPFPHRVSAGMVGSLGKELREQQQQQRAAPQTGQRRRGSVAGPAGGAMNAPQKGEAAIGERPRPAAPADAQQQHAAARDGAERHARRGSVMHGYAVAEHAVEGEGSASAGRGSPAVQATRGR